MFNFLFTFNRKIADQFFVPFFLKTPLKPNHITGMALLSGVAAGALMAQGGRNHLLLGAAFLQLCYILDNCDGQVARLKSMQSSFGMWLDFVCDLVVDFSLWAGLALGTLATRGLEARCVLTCFIAAVIGSLIHFFGVTQKRVQGQTGKEKPKTTQSLLSAAHILAHDGDPSVLVWFLALLGQPSWFLILGAIYINLLWIIDFVTSQKER